MREMEKKIERERGREKEGGINRQAYEKFNRKKIRQLKINTRKISHNSIHTNIGNNFKK